MNDRAWIATRKGLFELRRRSSAWHVAHISFLGDPVTMLLPPQPSGRMLAALNLGHFGVKLHASDDEGRGWNEVAVPTYPEQPADAEGPAWKLALLWSLEAVDGEIWAGTIPGGLFASADGHCHLMQLHRLAAYLQAGLLVPNEEETLTVRATRDALAKLDANPERLLQ